MSISYSKLLGFYLPSFFFLNIETDESLIDLDALTPQSKSTLYHEYVHFLQDITTLFGLGNIAQIVDVQKAINREIIGTTDQSYLVPVVIDNTEPAGINVDLFSLYSGDYDLDIIGIDRIERVFLEPNNLIPGFENVPSVIVEYVDLFGKKEYFNFGAICVMEGMAYLIEDSMFDDVTPTYFPYQVVKKICQFLYSPLSTDNVHIILLCDIALNSSHPGKFLFDFLQEMKVANFIPSKYIDLYDRLENYKFTDINQQSYSIYDIYKIKAKEAKQHLKDYFTIPLFDEVRNWIEQIIDLGTDFRIKNIGFWIDVLNYPTKEQRRNAFIMFTQVFGFPLMTNSRSNYYFMHPNIKTEKIICFKAIHEINQILRFGQKGCGMKEFCSRPNDITSTLCDNEPWKRAELDQLCPLGQVWKMWGLNGKAPVHLIS